MISTVKEVEVVGLGIVCGFVCSAGMGLVFFVCRDFSSLSFV